MDFYKWIEAMAMVSGIVGVWLNARAQILGWPVGLLAVLLAAVVYWHTNLFAEFGLHLFYAGTAIYGWFVWWKLSQNKTIQPENIKSASLIQFLIGIGAGFLLSMVLIIGLRFLPNSDFKVADAFITGFSLLAQFWLARKVIQNWLIWLIVDVGGVMLYCYKEMHFFVALYLVYMVLCIFGYWNWKKKMLLKTS